MITSREKEKILLEMTHHTRVTALSLSLFLKSPKVDQLLDVPCLCLRLFLSFRCLSLGLMLNASDWRSGLRLRYRPTTLYISNHRTEVGAPAIAQRKASWLGS